MGFQCGTRGGHVGVARMEMSRSERGAQLFTQCVLDVRWGGGFCFRAGKVGVADVGLGAFQRRI